MAAIETEQQLKKGDEEGEAFFGGTTRNGISFNYRIKIKLRPSHTFWYLMVIKRILTRLDGQSE